MEAAARRQRDPWQVLAVNLISCHGYERVIQCYGEIPMQSQFLTTPADSHVSKSTQPVAFRKRASQNNKVIFKLSEGVKNGAVPVT